MKTSLSLASCIWLPLPCRKLLLQSPDMSSDVSQQLLCCLAGAKFFPGFVNDRRRAALDQAALGWQEEGKARLKAFDRVNITQDQAALLPCEPCCDISHSTS